MIITIQEKGLINCIKIRTKSNFSRELNKWSNLYFVTKIPINLFSIPITPKIIIRTLIISNPSNIQAKIMKWKYQGMPNLNNQGIDKLCMTQPIMSKRIELIILTK